MRWRRIALLSGAGLVACGISATGQLELVGGADGGPPPTTTDGAPGSEDDGAIGEQDGGIIDAAPDTFDATLPCDSGLGDASVLVLPVDAGACPTGTVEKMFQTNPVAVAGACTCAACTPVTNPSCAGADLDVTWGGSNSCGSGADSYTITDNACIDWGYGQFSVVDYHGWELRTPTAGSCTAGPVTDVTKVTSTPVRTCVPSNEDSICAAQLSGQRLCVESSGACSGVFSQAVAVGDQATVACGACGCSRTSTKCVVEYHSNSTCTNLRYTAEANGVCTRTNNATSVQYLKVFAATPTCASTPGAATPSVTNPKTLCCTP